MFTTLPSIYNPLRAIVVWDLDETLIDLKDGKETLRLNLINTIANLKKLKVVNVLWTMGSLLHLVDMTIGTPLQYCFDYYFWLDHCEESYKLFKNYKHLNYLATQLPELACHEKNTILIDDNESNLSSFRHSIKYNTSVQAKDIIKYVESMCGK